MYEDCEAAVQSRLQLLTAYFDRPEDVTRGDFRVLDAGSEPYVILTPGPFTSTPLDALTGDNYSQDVWTIYGWLFVKHNGDGSEFVSLSQARTAVKQQLEASPYLGGVVPVTSVKITAGGEPAEDYDEDDGGPYFLHQVLTIEVSEFNQNV